MKVPKVRLMRWWRKGTEKARPSTGSLTRRIIGIAGIWIVVLLGVGGYALDRVLTSAITNNFDDSLDYVLTSLIASSEIGPEGEVLLNRPPADQKFLEPYSGLCFQITAGGFNPVDAPPAFAFPSRSLWDRRLAVRGEHRDFEIHVYDSAEFPNEELRVVERDARLPGSPRR